MMLLPIEPLSRAARSFVLAVVLLGLSGAVLCADESRTVRTEGGPGHCRIYFGCLPALAKERVRSY